MPLADPTTITNMDNAVQTIVGNLPANQEELDAWDCAAAWAPVATAFFSAAAIPSVTDEGKSAGESAFITACHGAAGSTNSMTESALSAGFIAYAATVVAPGMCLPPAPVVHAPPANPLVLVLSGLPPSEATLPSTTVLYNQLLPWAVTGTQTTPPAAVVPWS
tara:strand:- start:1577 stop:2065 length:489 start_codon:yes stop_codon:yes gene_type:complete